MPSPSSDIIQLLSIFSIAFTTPTFAKAMVLILGTILAPGRRTVTAALRMMGYGKDKHYSNYHRVLNRDRWSPWVMSKILLGMLIGFFLPAGAPLILAVDETLERRRGKKIKCKGWFRDPIRSTKKRVVTALGLRWICLAMVVPVPWSQRPWALPFMTILGLGEKTSTKLNKRHRTIVQWAEFMIDKVQRWQPGREIILVGDGSYAAIVLVQRCQRLKKPVKLVSRLRLDARLFDFPGPQLKSKRGPKPKKGVRQPKLSQRLEDPQTAWKKLKVVLYGKEHKIEFVTGVSLWHTPGQDPVPLRWVLVRCPEDSFEPSAFFCSNPCVSAKQIIVWFCLRWNIEITFEDLRAFLGFETQRQWSDRAIERTTPCLFGLFSLVTLMAKAIHPESLPMRQTSWYKKDDATFSDALAAVRSHLWSGCNFTKSPQNPDLFLIPQAALFSLLEVAYYSS
ncbi:MAG: transposase [Anaerolineaceae bacterium]|nr:transposase [Anaerolineaceae bacterium]